MTGLQTVPNVFVGGEFVGDSQKTLARLNAGEFDKVLGITTVVKK
jgi:glutaredoxin-related protein